MERWAAVVRDWTCWSGRWGEDPVRETLDVSGEDWESILSGGDGVGWDVAGSSGDDDRGDGSDGGVVG